MYVAIPDDTGRMTPEHRRIRQTMIQAVRRLEAAQDHRNISLAAHIAALYSAACAIVAHSSGDEVDMTHWQYFLPDASTEHLRAALYLIVAGVGQGQEGMTELADGMLSCVTQLLAQD